MNDIWTAFVIALCGVTHNVQREVFGILATNNGRLLPHSALLRDAMRNVPLSRVRQRGGIVLRALPRTQACAWWLAADRRPTQGAANAA